MESRGAGQPSLNFLPLGLLRLAHYLAYPASVGRLVWRLHG